MCQIRWSIALIMVICLVIIGAVSHAGTVDSEQLTHMRDFPVRHDQPRISGFVEIDCETHFRTGRNAKFHRLIWFQGRDKYRIQELMPTGHTGMLPVWDFFVSDGSHFYYGMGLSGRTHRVKWFGYPLKWIDMEFGSELDTFLQHPAKMYFPHLVGHELLYNLQVEHWQGTYKTEHGQGEMDVWVSTDAKYPLVLRVDRTLAGYKRYSWRVTKLNLSNSVPNYMFTAQTNPKGGLMAAVSVDQKSTFPYLIWYLLMLIVSAGIGFSAYWKPERRAVLLRIAGLATSLALLFALGVSDQTMYSGSFSDTPVAIAVLGMNGLFLYIMVRFLGLGGIRIAKGTTWASLLFIPSAALLSGLSMYTYQRSFLLDAMDVSSYSNIVKCFPGRLDGD